MKKYKNFLCVIALLAVFCIWLTACGKEPNTEDEPPVSQTPAAVQTPDPTPNIEPTPDVLEEPTPTVDPTPASGECYPLNVGGRQLMLALETQKLPDGDFYRVEALKVYDGEQLLSTTDTSALNYEGDYLFEGVFFLRGEGRFWDPIVNDFNFDGNDDLCLMASDHSSKNIPFAYFLWNEVQQRLEFSFVLSNFLTVDVENRCLIETVIGSAGSYEQYNTYQYDQQGALTLISTERVEWG